MTNHLATIREAAERLYEVGVGRTGSLTYTPRELQAIMASNARTILCALDEAEKALRNTTDFYNPDKRDELSVQAADLIESLQDQLAESQRRKLAARNELCLKCGRYREAHNGSCDGCRWKEEGPDA